MLEPALHPPRRGRLHPLAFASAILLALLVAVVPAGPVAATSPIPPTVRSLAPANGPAAGGNTVEVIGDSLSEGQQVAFGSSTLRLDRNSSGRLVVQAPPGRGGTTVRVTALGSGGPLGWGSATYTYDGRTRYAVTAAPARGTPVGGNTVMLTGSGIDWRKATAVWFGSAQAAISSATATEARVIAPAGTPGATVELTVRTSDGEIEGRTDDRYTYDWTSRPPVITTITPRQAYPRSSTGGTSSSDDRITIVGSDLRGATQVTVGGEPIEFGESRPYGSDSTVLTFTSPYRGPGEVDIRVTTPAGTSENTAADDLTILPRPGLPRVTSISQRTGSTRGGAIVTLRGEDLVQVRWVRFDGQVVRLSTVKDGEVKVFTPSHVAGTVDVTVEALGGKGVASTGPEDDFTFVEPGPLTLTPAEGPAGGGNEVTVSGEGYDFESIASGSVAGEQLSGSFFRVLRATPTSVTFRAPARPEGTSAGITLRTGIGDIQGTTPVYRWNGDPDPKTSHTYAITGSATLPTLAQSEVPLRGEAALTIAPGGAATGRLSLQPVKVRVAGTNLPITVTLAFVSSNALSGRVERGLYGDSIAASTLVRVKVQDARLFGAIPLAAGNSCQSKQLTTLSFDNGGFDRWIGGFVVTQFSLSDLNGCGPLEGLVDPRTASAGNSMQLSLQGKG